MANYKKFITLLLIFSIHMMPFNFAWALTTVRDWSITNVTRQGATTNLSATKSIIIDGNVINKTSTAKYRPTPKQVASIIKGGLAGIALSYALDQLIQGLDWVLDSANDRVIYYEEKTLNLPYLWVWDASMQGSQGVATAQDACKKHEFTKQQSQQSGNFYYTKNWRLKVLNTDDATCEGETYYNSDDRFGGLTTAGVNRKQNTLYNPNLEETRQPKYIPLDVVAEKVITNADSQHEPSISVTSSASDNAISNDSQTQQQVANELDSNAKTSTNEQATGDTSPKDPADPNAGDTIKLNFPVFCSWAPLVCEAAQTAINFPKTITEWYTSTKTAFIEAYDFAKTKVQEFSDIFKDEPQTDTELEFNDPTDDITDTSVSFSSSCPQPIVLADFNFHGIPIYWELDFSAWCDSLSTYLKPIVISMASFSAVLILGGVRENG